MNYLNFRSLNSITLIFSLCACGPAEVAVWSVAGAIGPRGHGPEMCEYNPVRAYIEQHNCKDANGQLLQNPITSKNVNTVFEGTCVLQMAIQNRRMDLFKDAWKKGANPDACENKSFYDFLLTDCRTNPELTQLFITTSENAGWFTQPKQAQALLERAVLMTCLPNVEWALLKGARVTQRATAIGYEGKSLLDYSFDLFASDYKFRQENTKNTLRTLLKSPGGCSDVPNLKPSSPEAKTALLDIHQEVCKK